MSLWRKKLTFLKYLCENSVIFSNFWMFSLSYFLLERVKKAFLFRVLKAAQANDVVEFT